MKVAQYIFTNCANNGFQGGYVEYGRSASINEDDARFIQQNFDFHLRVEYPYDASEDIIDNTFPRKLAFFKLPSGRYCLGQSTYIGKDSSGNRYGNYMIHAFVYDDVHLLDPYQFYHAPLFLLRLTKEELLGPVKGELEELEIKQIYLPHKPLSIDSDDAFKALMIFLRDRMFEENDKIYIRAKEEDYSTLLNMISTTAVGDNEPISFMTYLNNEFEYKENVNILFETQPVAQAASRVFGNFNVYYFDLIDNQTNANVEIDKVDDTWLTLLKEDENKAKEFLSELDRIEKQYHLESSMQAYTVKLLLDGSFDRFASIEKAIEIYNKHLHSYHLYEVADNLFNHLSKEEQNDPNKIVLLFDDLSAPLTKTIYQNYIRNVIKSNTNLNDVLNKLHNVPFGSFASLNNVLFDKDFFIEMQNENDLTKEVLFALAKNEGDALEIERQLSDKERVLSLYNLYHASDNMKNLALTIYNNISVENIKLESLKEVYRHLGQDEKLRLNNRHFALVMRSGRPYYELAKALYEENVLASKDESLSMLCQNFYATLIKDEATDVEKKVALVLSNDVNVDETKVLSIYNSLNKRVFENEKEIFTLVSKLFKPNIKKVIIEAYLKDNFSYYIKEEDEIRLLNQLFQFGDIQVTCFLSLIDSSNMTLEKAMEYLPQIVERNNPRVVLLQNISNNRTSPSTAKQYAERRNDDIISKRYLTELYEADLNRVIHAANNIKDCLANIENYSLEKDELERCLNVIYQSRLGELYPFLVEDKHFMLKAKAMANNIALDERKINQLETLYLLENVRLGKKPSIEEINESFYQARRVDIDEEFASIAYEIVIKMVEIFKDKKNYVKSLLLPLLTFDSIKKKFVKSDVNTLKQFMEYLRQEGDSDPFVPLLKQAIKTNIEDHKSERRIIVDQLGLTQEEAKELLPKANGALIILKVIFFPITLIVMLVKSLTKKKEKETDTAHEIKVEDHQE